MQAALYRTYLPWCGRRRPAVPRLAPREAQAAARQQPCHAVLLSKQLRPVCAEKS